LVDTAWLPVSKLAMTRMARAIALLLSLSAVAATAQDMMRDLDLASPDMVLADLTRADVAAAVARATEAAPADFTGKRLSNLDLSRLDLSGAIFRAARMNKTSFVGAKLDRAILDQAWLLEANFTAASLKGANLFAAQMRRARLDGADLSGTRIAADLTGASLVGASIEGANLGADMRNQSMGLMRAVLTSANLERVNARGADLSRVDLEFASLRGADLSGASLKGAQLGGADLTGVTLVGTDFDGADLASAKLIAPIGLDQALNFDKAKNRDRLIRERTALRRAPTGCNEDGTRTCAHIPAPSSVCLLWAARVGQRIAQQLLWRCVRRIQHQPGIGPGFIFGAPLQHVRPGDLGQAGDVANPLFDPLSMDRFIEADAFDDLEVDAMLGRELAPGGARRLDRVDRIDDDGMSELQMFVGQRLRDLIGRDPGLGFGEARAQHLRLDRIDREHGDGQREGQALRQRALARAGQAGQDDQCG